MGAHPRRLPTQAGTLCERTRSDTELLKMKANTSAIVIVCALAVCGTMIYFTADGQEEPEAVLVGGLGAPETVSTMRGPASVASTDVQKAGTIVTNTPDGRMRLTDYLQNVEKEIHAEESARKRDISAVRAQMDRNFAFNQAARKKLKRALLTKMAANARRARHDLARSMRYVQHRFARAAKLANRRNAINIRRNKIILARVAKDKARAAHQLRFAVFAQQRSMAALRSATNARINQTNKHVSANAAQIKSNAKAARKALASAVAKYDRKVAGARELAAKGRSKLAAQLQRQDKAVRAWASNKLKEVIASTASQFRKARARMARDRAHADMALKSSTSRMEASLNAFSALNDRRFASTVRNIAAAKAESARKIAAAQTEFKVNILKLRATVKQQVAQTNARITQLSGVVQKNKLEQAKINANVNAETKRMIKLGNDRYKAHLKRDRELKRLISRNKAQTIARMDAMAAHYNNEIGKVRTVMRRNRAHASRMLARKTSQLYSAISKQQQNQMRVNRKLAHQSRRARLDVADALRNAKREFGKRMAKLHSTIVRNDRKFDGKMKRLTGIVNQNAVKSRKGRAMLAAMMKSNRAELMNAVSGAVRKGENRMAQVEKTLANMSAKTKASLNMRITSEISKLASNIGRSVENLRLQSKNARAQMKKEMLFAVRSAAAEAKNNLQASVRVAKAVFNKVARNEAAAARRSAAARAAIARKLRSSTKAAKRSLRDAVSGLNRSMLALKSETAKKVAKTNRNIAAYANKMRANARAVQAAMKANVAALSSKIDAARKSAAAAIRGANAASAARQVTVLTTLKAAMAKAQKRANAKFGKAYKQLAKDRAHADAAMGGAVNQINQQIARQAALADHRFSHTVKNIARARAQAQRDVGNARKAFTTSLYRVTSTVKDLETRLSGEIAVVSGEVASNRAQQMRVNRRTSAELRRITKLVNDRQSASIRARGKLRKLLNENKRAAALEVAQLARSTGRAVRAIRSQSARNAQDAAKDLTRSTKKMYTSLAKQQRLNARRNGANARFIAAYSARSKAALYQAKKQFGARLTTLTNTVSANNRKTESLLAGLTGVIRSKKAAGKKEMNLIKAQTAALNKKIVRSIEMGEARGVAIMERARASLKRVKSAMLVEVSERVERTGDKLFRLIQGNHKKIADNYLSLKAYAATCADKLKEYVAKGKGRNLSSLGDLLNSVTALSPVRAGKAEGLGAGASELKPIFGGRVIKVPNAPSKINALVDEYMGVVTAVRRRWPMGIGKYLLMKTESSMQGKGVLQVDKVANKAGNWVFVNGRAVGLSSKLNDFETLAVHMGKYEATLAKMTSKMTVTKTKKSIGYVKPPEWRGD